MQRGSERLSIGAESRQERDGQSDRCQRGAAGRRQEGDEHTETWCVTGTRMFPCGLNTLFCVQLQDIASLTQDVKNQAMNTLDKAQKKKEHFENNNKKLKDFIKKIKDFLTGAFRMFRNIFFVLKLTPVRDDLQQQKGCCGI